MNDDLVPGDWIRLRHYTGELEDFEVEIFRGCLGVFLSPQHRMASNFTGLCSLYGRGPDSEDCYISNYGEYVTNEVPTWMQIPAPITSEESDESENN